LGLPLPLLEEPLLLLEEPRPLFEPLRSSPSRP
jgi:hypothetical protein